MLHLSSAAQQKVWGMCLRLQVRVTWKRLLSLPWKWRKRIRSTHARQRSLWGATHQRRKTGEQTLLVRQSHPSRACSVRGVFWSHIRTLCPLARSVRLEARTIRVTYLRRGMPLAGRARSNWAQRGIWSEVWASLGTTIRLSQSRAVRQVRVVRHFQGLALSVE